jgi:hypothetical protein
MADSTALERIFDATFERLLSYDDVDARKGPARKVRAHARQLATDLGGVDTLSWQQRQLVQRAAMLAAICEHVEAGLVLGRVNLPFSDYLGAIGVQKRIIETLGIERQARDVMTLGDLIRQDRLEQPL